MVDNSENLIASGLINQFYHASLFSSLDYVPHHLNYHMTYF